MLELQRAQKDSIHLNLGAPFVSYAFATETAPCPADNSPDARADREGYSRINLMMPEKSRPASPLST